MKTGNVLRWQRCVAAGLVAAVTGCSSTNPYQRSKRVDVPIAQLGREEVRNAHAERFAGNLHGALGVLKDQRREWYDSLSTQARVRAVTQLGLLGITAAALYSGLKSGVTSDHDKTRLALAGAVGFAAYSGSTWFVNPAQEQAYVEGIRELTCAMMNIEPLRMSAVDFSLMRQERQALTEAINTLDKDLLEAEAIDRYGSDSKLPRARVRAEAKEALWRARKTLASSEQLADQLNNSGVILMREGDLVFARVAARINAANKPITPPDTMASQAAGIIGKFRAVKIDAPSESSGGGGAAPPAPAAAGARAPAAPAVAAKSLGTASLQELLAQITVLQQQQIAALAAAKKTQEDKLEADAKKQPANASEASMARKLAKETADLYAARRPLSNRLLSFAEQRKSVERNGSCVGSVSAMTVAPADDAKVSPGEVYEIAVSGVTVWPQVTVKGSATSEILVGPAVNQFVVRIKVAADAKGTVDVSISDRGLATEDIQLTVGAPAAK
ncbi:hypothetical protein J2W35_001742 [Variovorax boronicumulans]|uniref:hypothetical protein n=1 Tax=Variovorax boronicumulans TaxID=436515 RepID=UPI002783D39D|nr:hypothetical protein [Variovorax boronicumulans]MDQ0081403.1 hypothetical protein [Variovorax boronicumulans]